MSLARADDAVATSQPVPAPTLQTFPTAPPVTVPVATEAPTSPPAVEPTAPPQVEPTLPPLPPSEDTSPVIVKQEQATPILSTVEPGLIPTQVEGSSPQSTDTNPQYSPTQPPPSDVATSTVQSGTVSTTAPSTATSSGGVTLPPTGSSSISSGDVSLDFNYSSSSAQAPPELTCSGAQRTPDAAPFLVSPYSGWTEMISFLDHDMPDYAVDGSIVIANGDVARASDGQESDMFPSYWSPDLRQYINYDGHNGYDYTISYQPVLAAGNGTISFAGWTDSGYGNMILVNHHNGYTTLYGHLSKLDVHKGEAVTAGEQIGISGATGHVSGPHLHFSVFHNCVVSDPYGWTGHATDPLATFDGERSAYLWLPGQDPLIVNPPPNWPAYPTGVKLDSTLMGAETAATRELPAADRLLLLALPKANPRQTVTSAVALARNDASITREVQALIPSLAALKRDGLVSGFQVLPSAAAIWVRGTASAVQLEALPGVASLSGLRPIDLQAAETGLAHSVLEQVGDEQAPSLWPAGFRSALQTWRPVATVLIGHALVGGAAFPGQAVTLELHRHGKTIASAQAFSDPQTGGFVSTLHDAAGNPVDVSSGDTLLITSGTRSTLVHMADLRVDAHVQSVTGNAAPHSTVPLEVISPQGRTVWRGVVTSGADGSFAASLPLPLKAGSEAIATLGDAAGDQQAATGFVPGLEIDVTNGAVHGWTVGNGPRLSARSAAGVVRPVTLKPASDGTFAATLPLGTSAITIGSRWHHHTYDLSRLSIDLTHGSRSVLVHGNPGVAIDIALTSLNARSWTTAVHVGRGGTVRVRLPRGLASGDRVTASASLPRGSTELAEATVQSLNLYVGSGVIRGVVPANTDLSLQAVDGRGRTVGRSVTGSDPVSGLVLDSVRDSRGAAVRLDKVRTLRLSIGGIAQTVAMPSIDLSLNRLSGRFVASIPAHSGATLLLMRKGKTTAVHLHAGSRDSVAGTVTRVATLRRAELQVPVTGDVTLVRVLAVHQAARGRSH
jgi:murein DD-endopeptidase MepM/ murein hydrolase activator NlpD